jgi:hypothetical protein
LNERTDHSGEIKFDLIDVAPAPVFSGLKRLHDRVLRASEMLCGMLILRRVATAHVTAVHAQPQMDPGISHLQALFTAASVRRNVLNLSDVGTWSHSIVVTHFVG